MKLKHIGKINVRGGIEPIGCKTDSRQFITLVRWRNSFTILKIKVDCNLSSLDVMWKRELAGGKHHSWAGHQLVVNFPSFVLSSRNDALYVISGCERLILDLASGELLDFSEANTSPSSPAVIVGDEILVPEGQTLCAYNLHNFQLIWRKPTPCNQWIFAPPVCDIAVLQHEIGDTAALWNFKADSLWQLPQVTSPTKAPILLDEMIVIPYGGGLPEGIIAIDHSDGSTIWNIVYEVADYSQDALLSPQYPLSMLQDSMIMVNSNLEIGKIKAVDGTSIWQTGLESRATALLHEGSVSWIGTADGQIFLLDSLNGVILDRGKISGQPAHIFSTQIDSSNEFLTLVVDYLGNIYSTMTIL
jgi:outer membrane protein assembly factor BamB